MVKYKVLSHTADLRLEVYGRTVEELFINAAEALAQILHPRSEKPKPRQQAGEWHPNVPKEEIRIQSANINALLVDFLNEILAKSQISKAVYSVKNLKVTSDKWQGTSVMTEIEGVRVQEFKEDVKAVTYHEVDIKRQVISDKQQETLSTKLVLDI